MDIKEAKRIVLRYADFSGAGEKKEKAEEAIFLIADVIDEHIKYRWHDLRVNPDDIPSDDRDVYVYFEYFRYGSYNCTCKMHGIGSFYEGKCSSVNGTIGWRELKILAWREIEPFESEE